MGILCILVYWIQEFHFVVALKPFWFPSWFSAMLLVDETVREPNASILEIDEGDFERHLLSGYSWDCSCLQS